MTTKKQGRKASEPEASRPYMPGYGILDAQSGRGLLPWSWAEERLGRSHNYWLATARPDGGPHAMPVWGIWLEGRFYFSTGQQSRKARNLALDPRCVVCTERGDQAVIVEGVARRVTDKSQLKQFARVYKAKYEWDMEGSEEPVYTVRPRRAFAFIENPEKPDEFLATATRWVFKTN